MNQVAPFVPGTATPHCVLSVPPVAANRKLLLLSNKLDVFTVRGTNWKMVRNLVASFVPLLALIQTASVAFLDDDTISYHTEILANALAVWVPVSTITAPGRPPDTSQSTAPAN